MTTCRFPRPGRPENYLRPIAVEFESADASPVPEFDRDLIAPDGHTLVVAGMAFQVSECHYQRQEIQSGERQDQPRTVERKSRGNRNNNCRKGTQKEKLATRGEGVIAPGRSVSSAASKTNVVHAKDPFCNRLRRDGKTQTHCFSRAEM